MNLAQLKTAGRAILAGTGEVVTIKTAKKIGRIYVVTIEKSVDFKPVNGFISAGLVLEHYKSKNGIFDAFRPI